MEGTDITAQEILMLCVLHEYEKFLIQDNLHGEEESNSAHIQKEILPNTNNSREGNAKVTENALKSIKDLHGRKLDIFAQLLWP